MRNSPWQGKGPSSQPSDSSVRHLFAIFNVHRLVAEANLYFGVYLSTRGHIGRKAFQREYSRLLSRDFRETLDMSTLVSERCTKFQEGDQPSNGTNGFRINGAEEKKNHKEEARGTISSIDLRDLWVDAKGVFIIGLFTVVAPVLAFGWALLPFKWISLYMALYLLSQNLPNYFSVRRFESWFGSQVFKEFGQVRAMPLICSACSKNWF